MKSWRTTLFGVLCFIGAAACVADNYRREAWTWNYWGSPAALIACGFIGDHKHRD